MTFSEMKEERMNEPYDWADDPDLLADETLARFHALPDVNRFHIPKTPEEWHAQNHRGHPDDLATCFDCGKARAKCRSKLTFRSWLEGYEWVREYNESHSYVDPLIHYQCRWCLDWHMGHPKGKVRLRKIERERRKWLIEKRRLG